MARLLVREMRDLEEKVERGAALLDFACPEWTEKIDLSILDLASPQVCVLGQTFKNYSLGLQRVKRG